MAVIRQRTQVFNKPVGVRRINTGEAEMWEQVSQQADMVGQEMYRRAAVKAQEVGADNALAIENLNITTIDPLTGKPEAFSAPDGFGEIATAAYQDVITQRFEDSINTELQVASAQMSMKYEFDAQGYDTAMSQRIAAMSENAQGKFKTSIKDNGAKRLALEKLNIQMRTRTKHRSDAAQSILVSAASNTSAIFDAALAGDNDTVRSLTTGITKNSMSGEVAELLKEGSSVRLTTDAMIAAGKGTAQFLMNLTGSPAERNLLKLFLATNGEQSDGIEKAWKDKPELLLQLKNSLDFINQDTRNSILTHASGVAAKFDAVDRDKAIEEKLIFDANLKQAKAEIKANSALNDLAYGNDAELLVALAAKDASKLFSNPFPKQGEYGTGKPGTNGYGVISHLTDQYLILEKNSEERMVNDPDNYKQTEHVKYINDLRKSIIQPFLFEASLDGNIDSLKAAIATGNQEDMNSLTLNQQALVLGLREFDIFNSKEDISFVQTTLNQSKNATSEKIKGQKRTGLIISQVDNVVSSLLENFNPNDPTLLNNSLSLIDQQIGKGLSATQAIAQKQRLRNAAAIGMVTQYSDFASGRSIKMNQLKTFIQTNGGTTTGMVKAEIEFAQSILDVGGNNTNAVIQKINGIQTSFQTTETIRKKEEKLRQDILRVTNGGGDNSLKKDRVLMDEYLNTAELSWKDYDNFSDNQKKQFNKLIKSLQPDSLIGAMKTLSKGGEVNDAEAVINHFARLTSDINGNGNRMNRLVNSLSLTETEQLLEINKIRLVRGGNIVEIAAIMSKANINNKDMENQERVVLNNLSPFDFVMENVKNSDLMLAGELSGVVSYLARTGKSSEEIKERLDQIADEQYPKVKYVVDPTMPDLNRSRFGLEAQFPDDAEREEFISRINYELGGRGYSLFADEYREFNAASDFGYRNRLSGKPDDLKQIYLVPEKSTAGTVYYAFESIDGELKPLIYKLENGDPFHPSFDKDDTKEWRASQKFEEEIDAGVEKARLDAIKVNAAKNQKIMETFNNRRSNGGFQ